MSHKGGKKKSVFKGNKLGPRFKERDTTGHEERKNHSMRERDRYKGKRKVFLSIVKSIKKKYPKLGLLGSFQWNAGCNLADPLEII